MGSPLLRLASLCALFQQAAAADSACPSDVVEQDSADSHMALLQTTSGVRVKDAGSVLYLVKSYSGNYDTKLRAQTQTWFSKLPRSSLIVLGDEYWPEFPVNNATMCGPGGGKHLACRVAYGMTLAAKTPGNWSWVFVVDDDHYVRTGTVERRLGELDGSKVVAGGCHGCGKRFGRCNGRGGFCGGCGYFFSKPAVKAMVGDDADAFMAFHSKIAESKKSDGREDMAISCALVERVPKVEIRQMPRMAGEGKTFSKSPDVAMTENLAWHHVTPEMMHDIHRYFSKSA